MITAIPTNQNRIAGHFKQAPQFLILNGIGEQLALVENPTPEQGCNGMDALLALLKRHKVSRIFTKNIGQRTLEQLLNQGISVAKVNRGRFPIQALFESSEHLTPYRCSSEGRESRPLEEVDSIPRMGASMTLKPIKQCCRTRNQLIVGQRRGKS